MKLENGKQLLQAIENTYDLGSSFNLDIVICGKKAMFTTISTAAHKMVEINVKKLGKELAELVLLNGVESPNTYGSWAVQYSPKTLEQINDFDNTDFYFNVELFKFWEMVRVICNNNTRKKDNKLYYVSYNVESGLESYKVISNMAELEQFMQDYGFNEMLRA